MVDFEVRLSLVEGRGGEGNLPPGKDSKFDLETRQTSMRNSRKAG